DRGPTEARDPGGRTQSRGQGVLMKISSIRTKLLLLVVLVALSVNAISAAYSYFSTSDLLRDQMVKRGQYIAANLAYNSKYGVLTEDKPLLTQLLDGALGGDVVGAMIRDAKGQTLAQKGENVRPQDLPATPAEAPEAR